MIEDPWMPEVLPKARILANAELLGEMKPDPRGVVTVILSYNSERYLLQAVESALMQKTNRPHQIWICDDASTDGSQLLIRKLVEEHPGQIFGILQRNNLYQSRERIRTLVYQAIPCGFIANLDADDYWTTEKKIESQCAALERDEDSVLSTHSWRRVNDQGELIEIVLRPGKYRKRFSLASFIVYNPLCGASVVVKAAAYHQLKAVPKKFTWCEDWELWASLSTLGSILVDESIMADYRVYASPYRSMPSTTTNRAIGDSGVCKASLSSEQLQHVGKVERIIWKTAVPLASTMAESRYASTKLRRSIDRILILVTEALVGNVNWVAVFSLGRLPAKRNLEPSR